MIADRVAWYRLDGNLLVADAHEGNVILTKEHELVPIDLNILQPPEAMRKLFLSYMGGPKR